MERKHRMIYFYFLSTRHQNRIVQKTKRWFWLVRRKMTWSFSINFFIVDWQTDYVSLSDGRRKYSLLLLHPLVICSYSLPSNCYFVQSFFLTPAALARTDVRWCTKEIWFVETDVVLVFFFGQCIRSTGFLVLFLFVVVWIYRMQCAINFTELSISV